MATNLIFVGAFIPLILLFWRVIPKELIVATNRSFIGNPFIVSPFVDLNASMKCVNPFMHVNYLEIICKLFETVIICYVTSYICCFAS